MCEQIKQAMHKAVSETVENMAFLEVLPSEEPPPVEEGEMLRASLLMHDPVQGEFLLVMPRNLLLGISEALFGLPVEELTEQLTTDAMLELLNTVAGQFLNDVIPGQVYRLGLPEVEAAGDVPLSKGDSIWHFMIEDEGFSISASGTSQLECSGR